MAQLNPGHFSIIPDDQEGSEIVATVRTDSAGEELSIEFKATIHMKMSAFEKLAKKEFKGVDWLSDTPVHVASTAAAFRALPMGWGADQ